MVSRKRKKIIVVTGCRSEYDILYSVVRAFAREEAFDVSLIVTGAHLCSQFGYTVRDIENDGFRIAGKVYNLLNSDRPAGKAKSSGILLTGLAENLDRESPDFVLAAGDREEALMSAAACTYLEIPFLHIAGGDRTYPGASLGDVDEQVRHAATKLANVHFVFAREFARRVIAMGEEPWRVCCCGNPALDRFKDIPRMTKDEVCEYFGFSDRRKPVLLVIQHVLSGEYSSGAAHMKGILEAVRGLDVNCVVNYPNSDMGSQGIIRVIDEYARYPRFKVTRHIPRVPFVNLLRTIDVLVGNSSLALCEGAYLRLPAVNVGSRQRERLHGGNVVFTGHETQDIRRTVEKVLYDRAFRARLKRCRQVYGSGNAAEKIVSFLKRLTKTREELIAKNITY